MVQISVSKHEDGFFVSDKLPLLLYAGHIDNEPDWNFNPHSHSDVCEIIYISEGEGSFIIDGKSYTGKKGDILIYNQGIVHQEKSNPQNPIKTYFCGVGGLAIQNMTEGILIPPTLPPVVHANQYAEKIESYISDIFSECHSQISHYELVVQNLLSSLIILIHRIISTEQEIQINQEKNTLSSQIKDYIDMNYTKNLSLSTIANTLFISPYYIAHIFKNEMGDSPINYLINRRIGEAKRLLLTTDKNISEIAELVGYDNPNYFANIFKKLTGVPPGVFRQNSKL